MPTTSNPDQSETNEYREKSRDVVTARGGREGLARQLRSAVGYRVDGPDGRIGVLRAVLPAEMEGSPAHLEISRGLFIVTTVCIPFEDVCSVVPSRRRVVVRVDPPFRRLTPRALERRVRRFLREHG